MNLLNITFVIVVLAMPFSNSKLLFKFGIISDIQYASVPNSYNFQKTKIRRYKQSIEIFEKAMHRWNAPEQSPIQFALILGDILDFKSTINEQQQNCIEPILRTIEQKPFPSFLCFGNHCHYCFSRDNIFNKILKRIEKVDYMKNHFDSSIGTVGAKYDYYRPNQLYYEWSPHPNWRFISIDSYDVSLIGASSQQNKLLAEQLLAIHNPNDLTLSGTWFDNLPSEKFRWVPYNGGLSEIQLNWLRAKLQKSQQNNEKVVIFSHQPIYATNKPQSLIWNSEEILDICWKEYPSVVCLWIAGHDHDGQYSIDPYGIHHLVPPAPIECEEKGVAFGHIEVHDDQMLKLFWTGKVPSNPVSPWPHKMHYNMKRD